MQNKKDSAKPDQQKPRGKDAGQDRNRASRSSSARDNTPRSDQPITTQNRTSNKE